VAEPPHRWWPATPFGLGWFGHPQAGLLGAAEPPPASGPWGRSAAPWAKQKFEHLAQRAAEPPPGPLVVVPPPQTGWFGGSRTTPSGSGGGLAAPWANRSKFRFWAFGPRGGRTTPWATGGGFATLRTASLGVADHHLWGGSATPAYIYIFFLFWIFFF
jgi:hypothetical protein